MKKIIILILLVSTINCSREDNNNNIVLLNNNFVNKSSKKWNFKTVSDTLFDPFDSEYKATKKNIIIYKQYKVIIISKYYANEQIGLTENIYEQLIYFYNKDTLQNIFTNNNYLFEYEISGKKYTLIENPIGLLSIVETTKMPLLDVVADGKMQKSEYFYLFTMQGNCVWTAHNLYSSNPSYSQKGNLNNILKEYNVTPNDLCNLKYMLH